MKRVTKRVQRTQSRTLFDLKFVRLKTSVATSTTSNEIIDLTQEDEYDGTDTDYVTADFTSCLEREASVDPETPVAGGSQDVKIEGKISQAQEVEVQVQVHGQAQPKSEPAVVDKTSRKKSMAWFKKLSFSDITVVVDSFNCDKEPNIDLYFLSHFHADHYGGLKKSWSHGTTIYTSVYTANLVKWKFKVNQCKLIGLSLNEWHSVSNEVRVILLDANHCPGSVIFLFHDLRRNSFVLHTGDFRANERIITEVNSLLQGNSLSLIYLDTTYLNPFFKFPALPKVCKVTADFASLLAENGLNTFLNRSDSQRSISQYLGLSQTKPILFVVLSYSIGKEHLAISIAKKLKTQLYVPHTKYQLVKQYISWFPEGLLTTDHKSSNVHLVAMHTDLDKYLSQLSNMFDSIVVFRPTGWTFSNQYDKSYTLWDEFERKNWVKDTLSGETPFAIDYFTKQKRSQGKIYHFNVPYSEHSSFKDLCLFSTKLKWDKIIPTVNLSQYREMARWFEIWKSYKGSQ